MKNRQENSFRYEDVFKNIFFGEKESVQKRKAVNQIFGQLQHDTHSYEIHHFPYDNAVSQ